MSNFLGIDIGGTNISFGIVNGDINVTHETNWPTVEIRSADELAERIFSELSLSSKNEISGIGIGAPSVNSETQQIEYAPNLEWGDVIPIRDIFEKKFDRFVTVMNDANAAAIGEKHYGGAKEMDNFAVVTLGTGIGLGTYVNGTIVQGENGLAGEIGHVVVHRDGRECNCGNFGCLEAYVGKEGVIRTAKEKLEFSSGGSMLNAIQPSDLSPIEIFNAARKEDPVSLEVVDAVSHDLGYALSNLVNILDIETIFLAGGISKAGNLLRRKTEKYMKVYTLPHLRNNVQLRISELHEQNGAVLGAAAAAKSALDK